MKNLTYDFVRRNLRLEISDIAKVSRNTIKDNYTLLKDLGFDSLDMVDLESRVESIFGIKIPFNYLERCEEKKKSNKSLDYVCDISFKQLIDYVFDLISPKYKTCSD